MYTDKGDANNSRALSSCGLLLLDSYPCLSVLIRGD
jgi:hypothetical protein